MSYQSELQSIWTEYEKVHGFPAASAREVVMWAVRMRKLAPKPTDIYDRLTADMARALREQTELDRFGRRYRVNHALRISKDGVQMTIWAMLDEADRAFMEESFRQRRDQIVGDCYQLATDIAVWNEMNADEVPLQMSFDFNDVHERVAAKTKRVLDAA